MVSKQFTISATLDDFEVEVRGCAIPYTPARTSGPIESCYPSEGGYCEDVQVFIVKYDKNGNTKELEITDFLDDDLIDKFSEQLFDALCDSDDRPD